VGDDALGVHAHGEIVEHLDAVHRAPERRRPEDSDSGSMMRSRLNFTSWAVTGSPLWKRWPLRR